jgi:hypothetical protein
MRRLPISDVPGKLTYEEDRRTFQCALKLLHAAKI